MLCNITLELKINPIIADVVYYSVYLFLSQTPDTSAMNWTIKDFWFTDSSLLVFYVIDIWG